MQSQSQVSVLLVDDRLENLIALEAMLSGLGQRLVTASSGEQALKCLLDQDFAVILMDVQMTGMDGFEAAELIRQRQRSQSTPIIFLTAFSDSQALRSRGYALGAVDYLLKPIDPMILKSKVAVFVDLFKKNLEVQQQAAQLVAKNLEILSAEAARQQAEAANRMKDEFLAVVSHELRTPLNSILGWSQLLLTRKFDQATTTQALETIARNAKSQVKLIEDILDMSRLMQNKLRLTIQPINAIAIIDAALTSVRPLADEKTIQLHTHLDEAAKTIAADPERLQQIVWNLLTNAIKFTPAGGQVTVHLSIAPPQSALPQIAFAQLQVVDTGIGITAEFLPHIFEHFRQADSSSTRSQGGLGLGLAIVSQLVALHQGKIVASSEGEGKGSCFTVFLPLASDALASETATATSADPQVGHDPVAPDSLDPIQVLLVDDHTDSRTSIKLLIEQAGATVTAVGSAGEAIACLDQAVFDILVSDIAMPGEDGYGLIRQVRARSPQQGGTMAAIALTAYAKPEDQVLALAAGFQMHLAKPVDRDALVSAIGRVVHLNAIPTAMPTPRLAPVDSQR